MATLLDIRSPSNTVAPHYAGIMEMSASDWVKVAENPRQRDTESRARRAKHLKAIHPTHSRVNLARLPTGEIYKLDGHTRAYLWDKGTLEAPTKVVADVWQCASIDDVKDLYGTFDSRAAVETTVDQVFGAVREGGLEFQSELLRSQRFAGAMRVASEVLLGSTFTGGQSLYSLFEYWTPELLLLDECGPSRKRFHTGVAASALLTMRRFGPNAVGFWKSFAMGGGIKMNGERDAVQALEERMESMRLQKQVTGRGNVNKIIRICLSAFDSHQRDYSYSTESTGIKALQDNSFNRWIVLAANTKRRWG